MIYHIEHLKNRAVLELRFKALEPISVGMYNEGNIRKIVGYINNGIFIPFIPSESVKGVLRNIATKIFNSMNKNNGFFCNKGRHDNQKSNQNALDYLKDIFDNKQLNELDEITKKELYIALNECDVCKLFGSNMVAGKLSFTDLTIDNNYIDVFNYTSTAIDRKRRIVREDSLFITEFIMPKYLTLTIIADNIERGREGRLFATLLEYMIKRGIKVGGLKSKGYGLIQLDEGSKVKIIEFKEVKGIEDIIYNMNALILKGNYRIMNIEEYINELRL